MSVEAVRTVTKGKSITEHELTFRGEQSDNELIEAKKFHNVIEKLGQFTILLAAGSLSLKNGLNPVEMSSVVTHSCAAILGGIVTTLAEFHKNNITFVQDLRKVTS